MIMINNPIAYACLHWSMIQKRYLTHAIYGYETISIKITIQALQIHFIFKPSKAQSKSSQPSKFSILDEYLLCSDIL